MELLNWATGLLLSLLTFGNGFMFYKQNKKGKELENEAKQSEEWRKLYELKKQEQDELETKVANLFKTMGELRAENNAMKAEIAEMRAEITTLTYMKCENVFCADRKPKNGLLQDVESTRND